jgi:hypothetical protein
LLNDLKTIFYSIELVSFQDLQDVEILIPSPIQQFLFDYKHSEFLECNSELSKTNNKKMKENWNKLNRIAKKLNYFTKSLEKMYKSYLLSDGTTLGN